MGIGGALGSAGKSISNAGKSAGDALAPAVGAVGGLLGIGGSPYKADQYNPDASAFGTQGFDNAKYHMGVVLGRAYDQKAPQMGAEHIDQTQQAQFRGQQLGLAEALQAQAMGQGPSLAQSQLRQGTDRNLQQALAFQASQRGANAGQGLRNIGMQAAQINQQAAQQAADIRMQEQMAARQQLAGVLDSGRGQDLNLATNQANLGQQSSVQNLAAQLQQAQINAQQQQFAVGGLAQMAEQDRQAKMALEQLKAGQMLGVQGINAQAKSAQQASNAGMLGGLAQAGAIYAASDVNLKTDISSGKDAIEELLFNVGAHSYVYKDSKYGDGRYVSPMAQELERSEIGRSMVVDTPDGKMVDYARAAGFLLSTVALLNQKIEKLEADMETMKHG